MCGTNKLTSKMELVLLRDKRISLFGMVLFSAMFSCFLLDSFELQEMVSIISQNMEPLSLRSTLRGGLTDARVVMNMFAIR